MLYRIDQRFCLSFWLLLEDLTDTLFTVQCLEGIGLQIFFQIVFYILETETEFGKFRLRGR